MIVVRIKEDAIATGTACRKDLLNKSVKKVLIELIKFQRFLLGGGS